MNGAAKASPPNELHAGPENSSPPIPPRRLGSSRYPVPVLPTWNSSPLPTGSGLVEPMSASFWLAASQFVGAHESSSVRVGESLITELPWS